VRFKCVLKHQKRKEKKRTGCFKTKSQNVFRLEMV